jgi:metal-dependent hydrolase (beta-lactamase superfamily II)
MLKLTDVKYLLNSHAHFDHSGGLAHLKKSTGALMISSEGDRSALIVEDYEETLAKAKILKVDVFLAPHTEFFQMHEKRERLMQGGGANPFVDPAEFVTFMSRSEADFRKQLAAQRARTSDLDQ